MRPKLYRHYDSEERLLYVGISTSIMARLSAHKCNSEWFDQVSKITIENFDNIYDMRAAEKDAIKKEKPIFNQTHAERTALRKNSILSLNDLAFYLSVPAGRIRVDLRFKRFPLIPETEKPFTWTKWKVDLHIMKPEIKQYIESMKLCKNKN